MSNKGTTPEELLLNHIGHTTAIRSLFNFKHYSRKCAADGDSGAVIHISVQAL